MGVMGPEPTEASGQGEFGASAERMSSIERQPELADLALQGIRLGVPILMSPTEGLVGERRPVREVPPRGRLVLPRGPELDPAVLANRVQKTEPAPAVGFDRADRQRSID
jgi:hypothetical protein